LLLTEQAKIVVGGKLMAVDNEDHITLEIIKAGDVRERKLPVDGFLERPRFLATQIRVLHVGMLVVN
jgi:hypothetical protein